MAQRLETAISLYWKVLASLKASSSTDHVYYLQRILTSTDLNTVQAYTYPDYNRDGTEYRFTAPVTCIELNAKVN